MLPCATVSLLPPTLSLPEVNNIILDSLYNFNTLSSRQVIRIKETINKGIVFCYVTKLSGKANKDMNTVITLKNWLSYFGSDRVSNSVQ